jgi:hypothetical protein
MGTIKITQQIGAYSQWSLELYQGEVRLEVYSTVDKDDVLTKVSIWLDAIEAGE